MKNNAKCKICKQGFVMGWNGTEDGCDECTRTVRDSHGYAWEPGERCHIYLDEATGVLFTVWRYDVLMNPR
jgi:hypothetical protein